MIRPGRLILCSRLAIKSGVFVHSKEPFNRKYIVCTDFHVSASVMAQRSITSFFKVSPPNKAKPSENKETDNNNEGQNNGEECVTNGKAKKSAKRSRVVSSDSETEIAKSPQITAEKKKKAKRQRIESSGSEPEHSCDSPQTPSSEKGVKQETTSPTNGTSSPEAKTTIKLEKTDSPKTYASPKHKKQKLTTLKEKKVSPSSKINSKLAKDSPKSEGNVKKEVASSDEGSLAKNKENKQLKDEKNSSNEANTKVVPEIEYNPASSKYCPVADACWAAGAPVPYLALARTFELIEGTSARLKIVDILANYFRSVIALTPDDLLPSVYMCLNQLAPAYHSVELGIAETYLMKAVGQCTGRSVAQLRAAARAAGDLGAAAAAARATQRTMFAAPHLMLRNVFNALKLIASMTGQASVNKKIAKVQAMFVACRHCEAKYLIRSLEGKLRIGLAEQSVLLALAHAAARTPPRAGGDLVLDASKGVPADVFKSRVEETALTIKTTYCECPNYELVIPALLQHGVGQLPTRCRLTVGIPLKPMLAHPTKGVHEVFNRFEGEEFTCEWKYDGERAQIHVPAAADGSPDFDKAAVFSRNQEDNTTKYPDVLGRLRALLKESVSSCILDCEAVAYDPHTKQILPFQVLATRKRKGAASRSIAVQVCVFVFDALLLNGRALVQLPLAGRRALLREHFREQEGCWQFATSRDCRDMEEMQQFMEEALRGSCEGLMVKALTGARARYNIARRSHDWLKLKKDYLEGCGDTIDVVIIGAYRGRGRRAGGFGGFLAAARDPHTDRYQALCKLGTGFTDDDLVTLTRELQEHVIDAPRNYYDVEACHTPDVWLAAAAVWEVRCADLSLSPSHRAAIGLVDRDKGISLRFPRFIRVRPDKSPEQATSAQQLADMYLAQDQVRNTAPAARPDDYY